MTVYTVIAYSRAVYTEILYGLYLYRAAAELHANEVDQQLNQKGFMYEIKVEPMEIDDTKIDDNSMTEDDF
jgi:hypothetical protein